MNVAITKGSSTKWKDFLASEDLTGRSRRPNISFSTVSQEL